MTKEEFVFDVMAIVSLLLSISVHEWAHAKTADLLGDDTPRRLGRVTLTPWVHWDPIGTVLMVISVFLGFGIGWGKPVPTDPRRYTKTRPHVGLVLVAAAGPLSNLLIALVLGLCVRFDLFRFDPEFTGLWAQIATLVNIGLFLFNLIPAPPLDGSKIILIFFREDVAERIQMQYQVFGFGLLVLVLILKIPQLVISPATTFLFDKLIGQ